MQATRFERPRGLKEGLGKGCGPRPRRERSLLPHDKIGFIYLTATATHLQNPTVSHHRTFLQWQLEGGCLATENKAGFHCKEHTTALKSLSTADPRNLEEFKGSPSRANKSFRKKDVTDFLRNKLAYFFFFGGGKNKTKQKQQQQNNP